MFFDPDDSHDPEERDVWDAADSVLAERVAAADECPDAVDRVVEVADMMTMFAAQRYVQIDAARQDALADAQRHGRGLSEVIERAVRLEIAAALRITEHAAGELIGMAKALVHRYPTVLDSLSGARMTERHAQVLVDAVDSVEPEFRQGILPRAVELAEAQPAGAFRRALRKLIETVRSTTLEQRHEEALRTRRVITTPDDDGMGWIASRMPIVEIHAIHSRVTAIAKVILAQEGETRTLDQIRADVFADLLIEGQTNAHPREARGIRATVVVTVPALALLDQDDSYEGDPAMVEGVGPIPLSRARELCGGADGWMRVLTHPETGMVLSVGREQYRPPPGLRKLVKWRADRCMAPGCGVPASRCEIDHTIAWEHGGDTSLENNAPLCKGHHIVKHHGGWCVRQVEGGGGALEWTSPTGRRYRVEPERRVPVFRASVQGDAPF